MKHMSVLPRCKHCNSKAIRCCTDCAEPLVPQFYYKCDDCNYQTDSASKKELARKNWVDAHVESSSVKKITKFSDIPQFTRDGNYAVDVSLDYLEDHLSHFSKTMDDDPERFQLDPDFQRGHVWTRDKQIAYVTYLLRGGTSSRSIYFNCPGWMNSFRGPMVLVDGKQRIEACRAFLRDELPVFGSVFSEFEDPRCLTRVNLRFHVNDLKTRAEVLQWYLDLNSGGVVHTTEELEKVKALLAAEKSS